LNQALLAMVKELSTDPELIAFLRNSGNNFAANLLDSNFMIPLCPQRQLIMAQMEDSKLDGFVCATHVMLISNKSSISEACLD
jgi:hypothetical protein